MALSLLEKLGVALPIFQAPMAGTSTPVLCAAVSEAGGLGAIGIGSASVDAARASVREVRARTGRAFVVNVFCHATAVADAARERAWVEALPFGRFGVAAPWPLVAPYASFDDDAAMQAMLVEERPPVVSFHFGLPTVQTMARLRAAGCVLFGGATSVAEAQAVARAGCDAVIVQGIEAGGHRGTWDPDGDDAQLGLWTLLRLVRASVGIPIIAAGGIMDGAGIQAALVLGAEAAQLGTAFIACPESAAEPAHRAGLLGPEGQHTELTDRISGRPARALARSLTRLALPRPPAYPIAYHAGKTLAAAARAHGDTSFSPYWAGQGAPLSRALPAAELVRVLADELNAAAASARVDR